MIVVVGDIPRYGRLAQLGERSLDVRKVAGSIPVPSIFFFFCKGTVFMAVPFL